MNHNVDDINSSCFSHDGNKLITGSSDGTVKVRVVGVLNFIYLNIYLKSGVLVIANEE